MTTHKWNTFWCQACGKEVLGDPIVHFMHQHYSVDAVLNKELRRGVVLGIIVSIGFAVVFWILETVL